MDLCLVSAISLRIRSGPSIQTPHPDSAQRSTFKAMMIIAGPDTPPRIHSIADSLDVAAPNQRPLHRLAMDPRRHFSVLAHLRIQAEPDLEYGMVGVGWLNYLEFWEILELLASCISLVEAK